MPSAVEAARATSMRTGLCRNVSVSRVISGGMVAEKNSVWRVNGTSLQMRSMSGMKPMSSMRSASSMTRISMPVSRILPRSAKSSRRPGVAISTSAPLVILASWSAKETPPISSATLSLWLTPYLPKASSTCAASSRVGSRISVRGMRARARPFSSMRQHRQRERRGLAGAGLGDAQDVAPLQRIGNGLFLNRRRRVVAGRLDGVEHFLAQAEFIKFHWFSQR